MHRISNFKTLEFWPPERPVNNLPFLTGRSAIARVLINALITWTRILGVLSAKLMTTPLLLYAMGAEGYGSYFAAVSVALLVGFLTSAMQATSLRAIALASKGEEEMSRLFNSLLGLHLLVAVTIMVIGATGGLWFVRTVLIIPAELSTAATFSFLSILVATTFTAFLAPYEAFLQARERFGIFAFLEILRTWFLFLVSYFLTLLRDGQMETYAIFTAGATMTTMILAVVIAVRDYPMIRPRPKYMFRANAFRLHSAIFTWTIVGSLSAVARNQGLAILVNIIGGPTASAVFALGNQIPAALRQFVGSLRQVLAPRIYARKLQGGRGEMVDLSFTTCKISMLITVALAVPLFVEMPTVLQVWLGSVDLGIVFVVSALLLNLLIDESSAGTGIAHMATGQLARLQIIAGGLSLLMLPIAFLVANATSDFRSILLVAVCFTALVALTRVLLLETHLHGATVRWLRETVLRAVFVLLPTLAIALAAHTLITATLIRATMTFAASLSVFLVMGYKLGLTRFEREKVRMLFRLRSKAE